MEINYGKTYINKTWNYLVPSLRGYPPKVGTTLLTELNAVCKLAVGIHDTLLDGSDLSNKRALYFLFDKKFKPEKFMNFLEWIRTQDYYLGDYVAGSNIRTERKHMVIIEIPALFNNAYDMFIQSKYSQMYTPEYIDILFVNRPELKSVLRKEPKEQNTYKTKLSSEFNLDITDVEVVADSEYELPLIGKEEIFNYENSKGLPYFVDNLKKSIIF